MEWNVMVATMVVALGTYLLRALPLGFALSRRFERVEKFSDFFALAGPSLIAAFLVVSVVPSTETSFDELVRRLLALCAVFLAHRQWTNFGVSVIIGVIVYALLSAG